MSLLTEIKKDQLIARKSKEKVKATLLTTLIGEAEMVGKNNNRDTTDDEVVAVVKKFLKGNAEILKVQENNAQALMERSFLEAYLPTQLTEDQIRAHVNDYIHTNELTGARNMGKVMGYLNRKYAGRFDGKIASTVVREILK